MALNDNTSTDQGATGTDIYVQALLNQGWRWDLAATVNAGRTIQYVLDGTWSTAEQDTVRAIFDAFQNVANIKIEAEPTNDASKAEIVLHHTTRAGIGGFFGYSGTPFEAENGATGTLGPIGSFAAVNNVDFADVGRVHTYIAFDAPPFVGGLAGANGTPGVGIGQMGFEDILHEIGHALGLKHPFDGGPSGSTARFPAGTGGISGPYDFGDNRLSQSIYTVMTYNATYDVNANNLDFKGSMASPMAFDIAALQQLYGAVAHNSGDNTYVLPDSTSTGAAWISIWDTGGDDTIAYDGTANAVINLTPASLDNSPTGGGVPSYTYTLDSLGNRVQTPGGFTIAGDIANFIPDKSSVTGVIIENAHGGGGNDLITGNAADNKLTGAGGNDTIDGAGGNDTAIYSGTRLDHVATLLASGSISMTDQRPGSPDGTDTVSNVENFQFSDGTFNQTEALNRPPVLSPDGASPHALTEISGATNSSTLDQAPPTPGTLSFTDVNVGDTHTASASLHSATWSAVGDTIPSTTQTALANAMSVSIGVDGTSGSLDWQFSLADKNVDFLAVGETLTVVYDVTVADHHTGSSVSDSSTQQVTIIFTGTNDNPIASPDSNGTPKNSTLTVSSANGVLANDTDPDAHDQGHLFVSTVGTIAGTYGSLTLKADGSYVYVADQGPLPAQIVAQDTFEYTVADGNGGTDTANLSIVVFNPGVSYLAGANTILNGGNGPDVVDGSAGHDTLFGGNGPDVLIGGNGDTLTGGNGPDAYLFRLEFGANTITDFDINNDAIQLDKSIFTSVSDMLNNHTTDTAIGAVITAANGDTITLVGVTVAQLQAHTSDFHLV